MKMTPEQSDLIVRIRALLTEESLIREVSMFGGISVMVNEKMIVSALKDGALLVRVDADRHRELLNLPGASQAVMGAGREMGPGWIKVEAAALRGDEQLSAWVEEAMAYNLVVTGGNP